MKFTSENTFDEHQHRLEEGEVLVCDGLNLTRSLQIYLRNTNRRADGSHVIKVSDKHEAQQAVQKLRGFRITKIWYDPSFVAMTPISTRNHIARVLEEALCRYTNT